MKKWLQSTVLFGSLAVVLHLVKFAHAEILREDTRKATRGYGFEVYIAAYGRERGKPVGHLVQGAIICKTCILTVAHAVWPDDRKIPDNFKEHSSVWIFACEDAEFKIKKFDYLVAYQLDQTQTDIAVVTLDRPICENAPVLRLKPTVPKPAEAEIFGNALVVTDKGNRIGLNELKSARHQWAKFFGTYYDEYPTLSVWRSSGSVKRLLQRDNDVGIVVHHDLDTIPTYSGMALLERLENEVVGVGIHLGSVSRGVYKGLANVGMFFTDDTLEKIREVSGDDTIGR